MAKSRKATNLTSDDMGASIHAVAPEDDYESQGTDAASKAQEHLTGLGEALASLNLAIKTPTTKRDKLQADIGSLAPSEPAQVKGKRGRPAASKPATVKPATNGKRTRGKGIDPDKVYALLEKNNGSKREAIAQELGVESKQLSAPLAKLKAEGRARITGKTKNSLWFRA